LNRDRHTDIPLDVETLGDAAAVRRYAGGDFVSRLARLELAGAESGALTGWRAELRRSERACGCREGAAAVFVALLAMLTARLTGFGLSADQLSEPLVWLGVVFTAGAIGKFTGLAMSMVRLRRLASAIERWEAVR